LDYASSSPGIARAQIIELVRPWASDTFQGELSLLVSELVANAVAHGLPEVHLDVRVGGRSLIRVEVSDGSRSLPELQPRSLDRGSGRGLQFVDAMASIWGTQLRPQGKVVWFELVDASPNPRR
jgi:two-component sensor histidine kinase